MGTIAAADSIVRTHPPLPECIVVLGTPWLSKAVGEYISEAAGAGARVVVVDPWRQWADPLRAATEFHFCPVEPWLTSAIDAHQRATGMARVLAMVGGTSAERHRGSAGDGSE